MYNRTIIFSAFVWLQLSTTASLLWTLWELDVSNHAWEVHVESHQLSPSWNHAPPSHEISWALPGWPLGDHSPIVNARAAQRHGLQMFYETILQHPEHLRSVGMFVKQLKDPPKKNMVNPGKPFFNIIGFSTSKIYYLSMYIYIWLLYDCLNKNIKARNGWTSPMFDLLKA